LCTVMQFAMDVRRVPGYEIGGRRYSCLGPAGSDEAGNIAGLN